MDNKDNLNMDDFTTGQKRKRNNQIQSNNIPANSDGHYGLKKKRKEANSSHDNVTSTSSNGADMSEDENLVSECHSKIESDTNFKMGPSSSFDISIEFPYIEYLKNEPLDNFKMGPSSSFAILVEFPYIEYLKNEPYENFKLTPTSTLDKDMLSVKEILFPYIEYLTNEPLEKWLLK